MSLDDIAAADTYGQAMCGWSSTADSAAAVAGSGCQQATAASWNAIPALPDRGSDSSGAPAAAKPFAAAPALPAATRVAVAVPDHLSNGHDSSDCDLSHTVGDGESSGVGYGKRSSHSEASEDNTAGAPASAAGCDEEHISPKAPACGGLSLMRLNYGAPGEQQRQPQQGLMSRAYSVDNFALSGEGGYAQGCQPSSGCTDTSMQQQRRPQVFRTYSYIGPDTLPMEFSLGADDSGRPVAFGSRGRSASMNDVQLRRQWLHGGELLAPQLPPSVDELELLELPEDTLPFRPTRGSAFLAGSQLVSAQPPLRAEPIKEEEEDGPAAPGVGAQGSGVGAGGCPPGPSGLMQFRGDGGAAAGSASGTHGVVVKRKIITTPSPLLHQPRQRVRQPPASAGGAAAATAKGQSPKRAKVGAGGAAVCAGSIAPWEEGAADAPSTSSAGVLAGWQPPRHGGGGMKSVRSMPANMNSFMEGVEVTVQPLNVPFDAGVIPVDGAAASGAGPNGSVLAPAAMGVAAAQQGCGAVAVPPAVPAARPKGSKRAQQPPHPPPPPFIAPGMAFPEPRRHNLVPSVPKPRKRASPNGNPPKAPAPNPNGHCCTQCGTQTTPVWRAGPHGPKTLCNACGVRYMKVAKGNVAPTPRKQQQHNH
ncbi:hypothetical protein GPECTOR_56g400 [Gonium pectorale]|uniref:GATA-type domain-containing protein n=1 Tax=Gonium pectorale TaxID=33097 RepID=A0A150G656_GONPE|nr:hypothetical protein GPECTOR_56g400 [Gonium pectorale]|eukprot:KXZ45304.1 hypothetical protein GPECTOR_56g400 [Gonium pectorale]